MTDLSKLIAEAERYGDLGQVRELGEFLGRQNPKAKALAWDEYAVERLRLSNAALAEALALVVKEGKMLELALDDLSESPLGPMSDAAREVILANLARRAEESRD